MFGQKYGPRKMTLEKTSRREVSSPESETGRKGSKSGAPAEIGRYHMNASCSMGWNSLRNFGRGLAKKHFCEIISKSVYQFSRRSCSKLFLFIALAAILFNRPEQFEQFWKTV